MKIWEKEPGKSREDWSRRVEEFTVGRDLEFDIYLAPYDIQGSVAHARMLEQIGLLANDELFLILESLEEIRQLIEAGKFQIQPGVEDVHSQVELMLTNRLGDLGKKIHTGRSRNDQVLLDIKLLLRAELQVMGGMVYQLFDQLILLSNRHREVFMPGYTHFQAAMPSSFGLRSGLRVVFSAGSGIHHPPPALQRHELQFSLCLDDARKNRKSSGHGHGHGGGHLVKILL